MRVTSDELVLPDSQTNDPDRNPAELDAVVGVIDSVGLEFLSNVYRFEDVFSGLTFDPALTEGYLYEMTDGSLFTGILGFPDGFNDPFEIYAEGMHLGTFGPNEQVDFESLLGHGVDKFAILGIDPMVDSSNPLAFPLQLEFDTFTASFQMQGIGSVGQVPEPTSLAIFGFIALTSVGRLRRRRTAHA